MESMIHYDCVKNMIIFLFTGQLKISISVSDGLLTLYGKISIKCVIISINYINSRLLKHVSIEYHLNISVCVRLSGYLNIRSWYNKPLLVVTRLL